MKITGSSVVPAPVSVVWDAILDPQVLVGTIPGCSRLESTGENSYAMTVTAGVAAIKGTYEGTCVLSDLLVGESLVMALSGAGAPGTVDALVRVSFTGVEGGTEIGYDADATVGGMVGGVGQRMLTSVARRMAAEFFGNVARVIQSGLPAAPAGAAPRSVAAATMGAPGDAGQIFTPAVAASGDQDTFTKGLLVGAGLALAGVLVGRLLSRK
ncbi:MAG: SRPBCC family protein [Nocardioides sp.]